MSHPAPVNSREAIDARRAEGRIPRLAPFTVVFARPVLALLAQGLTTLPRLQVISRSTWCPVALVALGWSLQHSFLPWIDTRHGLYLFLAFVPLTIALQVVYLRVRRLTPLVIGHGLMDLSSVLLLLRVG